MFYSCKFSFASHFRQLLSKKNFLVCHLATAYKVSIFLAPLVTFALTNEHVCCVYWLKILNT